MTETQIRKLRDEVFCHQCSDVSWENMKANWMRPDSVQWLVEHSKIKLTDFSPKKRTQRIY